MNRADLESYLKKLGIAYQVSDHEEVFTVEALMKAVADKNIAGLHMKNLFLKDKKKRDLYLLSARHDVEVSVFCSLFTDVYPRWSHTHSFPISRIGGKIKS